MRNVLSFGQSRPFSFAIKPAALTLGIIGGAMQTAQAAENYSSRAGVQFRLVEVATGLANPWSLAFLPEGDMLVTERPGRLRLIQSGGRLERQPVAGTPKVVERGQGGLLDVAVHPRFAENKLIYLTYSGEGQGGVGTEVMRARLNGEKLENPEVIFRAVPKTPGGNHFGSRLLFAPDGNLLVTLGDRFSYRNQAQNLTNNLGKIIRIRDDGGVPDSNPFKGQANARPEIYTYGHRNGQGLALRPGTSEIWTTEHGPRGGDELNILKAGANYGWPKITYGINYDGSVVSEKKEAPGMEQPVVFWAPSIAPSGMTFYDGDKYPAWKGDLFVGALALVHLRRIRLEGQKVVEQEVLLDGLDERIRDVRSGPDGYLYIVTDDPSNGRVLRLEPM